MDEALLERATMTAFRTYWRDTRVWSSLREHDREDWRAAIAAAISIYLLLDQGGEG